MEILNTIMAYLPMVLEYLGALTVVATVVVRFAPQYGESVNGFTKFVWNLIHKAPTLGINPQTRALEKALDALITPE